jgi:hypothetical protein
MQLLTTAAIYYARKLAWPYGKCPSGALHSCNPLVSINLNNEIIAAAGRQKSDYVRPAPKEKRNAAVKTEK